MCKYCDMSCTCFQGHAPCGYCISHSECEMCEELVCNNTLETVTNNKFGNKVNVCEMCYNESD